MDSEMLCQLPKAMFPDDFEDLPENMELDEELLKALLEEINDDNIDQTSIVETAVDNVLPVKEKTGDSSYFLHDHESRLLFDQDYQIHDIDYWIAQDIVEMHYTFPGLAFENEMIDFWHVENQVEEDMIDDIAYVELWEK